MDLVVDAEVHEHFAGSESEGLRHRVFSERVFDGRVPKVLLGGDAMLPGDVRGDAEAIRQPEIEN